MRENFLEGLWFFSSFNLKHTTHHLAYNIQLIILLVILIKGCNPPAFIKKQGVSLFDQRSIIYKKVRYDKEREI
jgi:hypothetical protein